MSVPKLRFKEFNGKWEDKKFKDVTEILRCGIASTPVYVEKGIPFLSAQNVNSNGQVILDKYSFIAKDFYEKISKNHKLLKGDLLYSRVGASFGNSAVFQLDGEYGVYVSLTHIRPNKTLNNFYLNFYLNSDRGKKQAQNGVFQGGGVPNLNVKIVEKFEISFPTIQEQTKIADFLMAVDEKIAQLTQKCELLARYKKGVMQQIFSQELRFKDDSDRNFPDWENDSLLNLSKSGFTNGVFNDPSKVGSGYKLINVLDMYIDSTIDDTKLNLVELSEDEFNRNKVKYGDTFFTRSSLVKEGIAHSNVYLGSSEDVTFDGHLIRMSPKKDLINPMFFYYLLKTSQIRQQFVTRGKTTTMTTIGQADIATVVLNFPSIKEQTKIANFLTSIDEKITEAQTYLDTVKQYKQGLLQQMFV